ncbi:MAG: hypothetical protein M3492_13440, partial [Actinomycetota bacterium]|nr:hypothetical protein [Actinomycetota bacterium]
MTRRLRVLLVVVLIGGVAAIAVELLGAVGRDVRGDGDPSARPVPPLAMAAYVSAAARVGEQSPNCAGMTWPILAGVGAVESA